MILLQPDFDSSAIILMVKVFKLLFFFKEWQLFFK